MMDFKDVTIPQGTLSAFERLVGTGTFPHSALLTGSDEEKLMTVARELSAALVCENPNPPCKSCPNCVKSLNFDHPDIITVSPQERRKSVNMEECRAMIMDTYVLPNEAQRKIYIVTSAENLDEKVQNAMLKILEEPPQYVYFILLCTNPSAMLGTVMSRVSLFSVGNDGEYGEADDEESEIALGLAQALGQINETELIRATVPLDRDRQKVKKTMAAFKSLVNTALRSKHGLGTDETGMASHFTSEELMRLNSCADEIISACDRNANEKLLITLISATFRHAIGG